MPAISIIIPVYNVEPWLRECLDAVRAQTFTDWECICVDDGSTDASPSILDEYGKEDSRFFVVRREHTNAGACRNEGLSRATGPHLLFLDSDDVFHPRMFELLLKAANDSGADVASCGMFEFEDGTATVPWPSVRLQPKRALTEGPADEVDLFARWVGWAWDKLFRRDFIIGNHLRFQEIPSSNDACFTYSALSLARSATIVDAALVAHRKRAGSIESTRNGQADCIVKAILAYRNEMLERKAFDRHDRLETDFRRWALRILLWHLDTIESLAGFAIIHSAIPELARTIGLDKLDRTSFDPSDDSLDRLGLILDGASTIESIRFHERRLFERAREANRLMQRATSRDYRLGNAILRIPRRIKRLLNGLG